MEGRLVSLGGRRPCNEIKKAPGAYRGPLLCIGSYGPGSVADYHLRFAGGGIALVALGTGDGDLDRFPHLGARTSGAFHLKRQVLVRADRDRCLRDTGAQFLLMFRLGEVQVAEADFRGAAVGFEGTGEDGSRTWDIGVARVPGSGTDAERLGGALRSHASVGS